MRRILGELVAEPSDVDKICPPTTNTADMSQNHGFNGIKDPRARRMAETAAYLLDMADRRHEDRDPAQEEILRAILGKRGYELIVQEEEAESSVA